MAFQWYPVQTECSDRWKRGNWDSWKYWVTTLTSGIKSDQNWKRSRGRQGLTRSMVAPVTTASFEECHLNSTTGQTEYNSELGLQFPSRGEQFAAAGGGDPWAAAPGPSAGATVQVLGEVCWVLWVLLIHQTMGWYWGPRTRGLSWVLSELRHTEQLALFQTKQVLILEKKSFTKQVWIWGGFPYYLWPECEIPQCYQGSGHHSWNVTVDFGDSLSAFSHVWGS